MKPSRHPFPGSLSKAARAMLALAVCVLILKVTIVVMTNYRDYVPPNFESDFLLDREAYFWNGYHWAFYSHIVAGPWTLIVGMILLSDRFRIRHRKWHRSLGKVQTACVLLIIMPSGLWMAMYAATGAVAGAGFGSLAVATGWCVYRGWKSAITKQFDSHRRWMLRCYVLLCSAVLLRLTAGFFIVADIDSDWLYPMSAWTSWLVPLAVFELINFRRSPSQQSIAKESA
jgi:hypothetical protein